MPRQSRFATFLDDAQRRIEAITSGGRGNHARRGPLLRELLEWSVLRQEPGEVTSAPRISTALKRLEKRRDMVACAVHGNVRLGISLMRSASLARVAPGDLNAITRLARRGDVKLADLDRNADDLVRSAVDRYVQTLVVTIEQRALEDLLLAALEAYAVPRPGPGHRYTEAYGYCFGTQRRTMTRQGRDRRHEHVVNVRCIVTQLRSRATANEVWPNDRSTLVHRSVAKRFFRHLVLLGDYHTHPFRNYAELRERGGWTCSAADERHIAGWAADASRRGGDPRSSLIAAVADVAKSGRSAREKLNRVRYCVDGGSSFWPRTASCRAPVTTTRKTASC